VALWIREIVRQLIEARFGVALTVASVGRSLHELGFSAQRSLYRAEQADPAAVARWKAVEYPKIAAEARAVGDTVYFVASTGGALQLYRLPAYSPQLSPDEWVWNHVKHDGETPTAPKGPEQMKAAVTARLSWLQRLPHAVRGCFGDPKLAYVTHRRLTSTSEQSPWVTRLPGPSFALSQVDCPIRPRVYS
jgi:Winged helix-turn helix